MNIWFISKYASPANYSKMPARLFCLAKEMAIMDQNVYLFTSDANHFATFPPTKKTYNDELVERVKIRWIKTFKYSITASVKRILSWLDFEMKLFFMDTKRCDRPDVVIVSSLSIFSIVYGYYLKKKYRCALVFEIRDIWPLTMTEEGGFSKWHPLVIFIGMLEKFGYRKADLIVGTMPRLDKHVKSVIGIERPFFCSPMGFEPREYIIDNSNETSNPFREFVPTGKIIVGYAGSMGITNALETFIKTIKLMRQENRVHFLLVGSGDLRRKFELELGDCTNVTFHPRIPQNEVQFFLDVCDILYLSTKSSKVWEYGQSMNKVVEYMLAGKPIIASYSGYPSMINEANCGFFVDTQSEEQLKNVIIHFGEMSKKERMEMGLRGKEWIYKHRQYKLLAEEYLREIKKIRKHVPTPPQTPH